MDIVAKARIMYRRNGEAGVMIRPIESDEFQIVKVDDDEPDDIFGPIFQRAAETIGLDFQVEYIASLDYDLHWGREFVEIARAE